jgi:hypothetical protein
VRICAGQDAADEELLLRGANLKVLAAAEPVSAAPVCCSRDHGVFLSDSYIQLMTPHVRAMLASPASPVHLATIYDFSSASADAVELVKVRIHMFVVSLCLVERVFSPSAGAAACFVQACHACHCG